MLDGKLGPSPVGAPAGAVENRRAESPVVDPLSPATLHLAGGFDRVDRTWPGVPGSQEPPRRLTGGDHVGSPMYTVLLPVKGEASARRQAAFVAALPDAGKSVMAYVTHSFEGEEERAPEAMKRPSRVDAVRAALEVLEDAGVATEVRETPAPVADGIVDLAAELEVDQVVITGPQSNPVGKAVFGSVAQDVLLGCERPVTLIGSQK